MQTLALLTLVIGLVLIWLAKRIREGTGVPAGRIIYADPTKKAERLTRTLIDQTMGLAGRPDYLVKHKGKLVPVEAKSARSPTKPHRSHVMQLAGYCLLVEATYGSRPPFGIIKYADHSVRISYSSRLEKQLRRLVTEVHAATTANELPRSHQEHQRCGGCGHRRHCDQVLS